VLRWSLQKNMLEFGGVGAAAAAGVGVSAGGAWGVWRSAGSRGHDARVVSCRAGSHHTARGHFGGSEQR
jgi:hypothetical protein